MPTFFQASSASPTDVRRRRYVIAIVLFASFVGVATSLFQSSRAGSSGTWIDNGTSLASVSTTTLAPRPTPLPSSIEPHTTAMHTTTTPPPQMTSAVVDTPRVAFCLSGGARAMRLALPSMREHFINAMQPDLSLRHVFLELHTQQDCLANRHNTHQVVDCVKAFKRSVAWMENRSVFDDAFGGPSGYTLNIENDFRCSHPFASQHVCCLRDGRAMNDHSDGFLWGMAQYMRRRLCYNRVLKHEAEHHMKFDVVAFSRPDMLFLDSMPPAKYYMQAAPRVHAMAKDDGWADFVFVMPRNLSDAFDQTMDAVFSRNCDVHGQQLEGRLNDLMNGGNLPARRSLIQAAIIRSPRDVDCDRLKNGVNDEGRYASDDGGALVSIVDLCRERAARLAAAVDRVYPPPPTSAPPKMDAGPPLGTHGPRVAFCLSGGSRAMLLGMPSISEYFINELQPDPTLRHVFLEVSTTHDCFANHHNAAGAPACMQRFKESEAWMKNTSAVEELLGGLYTVNVVNDLNCQHPFMIEHQCCLRDPRTMNDNGDGFFWGMAQYMRRRLCYSRIQQYEAQYNMTFDLVAITRPDMVYIEPLPPAEYFLRLQPPRVFAMNKDDGFGDYIFIAPRSLSDRLNEGFDAIFTEPCKQFTYNTRPTPEGQLGNWIDGGALAVQRWPFQTAIIRTPKSSDCGRLGNGLNDAGRYVSVFRLPGQLIVVSDSCGERTDRLEEFNANVSAGLPTWPSSGSS